MAENIGMSLDLIAEYQLPPDASWQAARFLGDTALDHLLQSIKAYDPQDDPRPRRNAFYEFNGMDEPLYGVSEQPDLTGSKFLQLGTCHGEWVVDRGKATNYRDTRRQPRVEGSFVGLRVEHRPTMETLLTVALPTSDKTASLLRHGYMVSCGASDHELMGVGRRYSSPQEHHIEPRRIQTAAILLREIISSETPARNHRTMSPEESRKFNDKYFPFQELALTGGGGKTVRGRYYAPSPKKLPSDEAA